MCHLYGIGYRSMCMCPELIAQVQLSNVSHTAGFIRQHNKLLIWLATIAVLI